MKHMKLTEDEAFNNALENLSHLEFVQGPQYDEKQKSYSCFYQASGSDSMQPFMGITITPSPKGNLSGLINSLRR